MIGLETGPLLIAGALATGLIGALGMAIRRSIRRQECARLRDQLVDAARTGELDLDDWRVFSLIDWFDQVASTGRTTTGGRHAPGRPDPADSLAHSLAATLLPIGPAGLVGPWWPERSGPSAAAAEIRTAAICYRERCQRRAWTVPAPARVAARVPALRRVPPQRTAVDLRDRFDQTDQPGRLAHVPPTSLVEEIFAVAGSDR